MLVSSGDGSGEVVGFLPAGDAPVLEPSVSGLLPLIAVLAADAWVVASPAGSVLQIRLRYATAVLDEADVIDIADGGVSSWVRSPMVTRGPVGLSPSDVPRLGGRNRGCRSHQDD